MGVWSSAFLHRFQDGNPANYNAVPGSLSVLPDGLAVRPTPPSDQLGFPIRPGQSLEYAFARAFDAVVGVDVRLDAFFPAGSETETLSGRVVLAGGDIRLLTDFASGVARLQLFVGGQVMALSVAIAARGAMRIQARWHTHGQAVIWVNGVMRGYRPNLAAGASFTIDRLAMGHHSSAVVPNAPAFLARRFCVKLLRRDDPARFLDKLHPIADPLPLDAACARQIAAINQAAMTEIRQFMSAAVARLTSAWQEGQTAGPFSDKAIAAHDAAVAAGRAFVEFMVDRRDADADRFLEHAGVFLQLVEATDPAGYAQLVARLEALSGGLDPRCRDALEPLARQHESSLGPVATLLQALSARVRSPGGTHG